MKYHFPECISKYGNPDGLCFNDHPSMEVPENRIRNTDRTDDRGASLGSASEDEEMYDAQYVQPERR